METAAHQPVIPTTSPAANHRLLKPEHVLGVRAHVRLPMSRGAYLTLRRVSANTITIFKNRFQDPPRFFCAHAHSESMADEAKNEAQPKLESIGNEKELEEESKKELPPPPEEPLPGDCCGSGCVRCVWDVYYEELEAYDKLYKSDSDPKSTPS